MTQLGVNRTWCNRARSVIRNAFPVRVNRETERYDSFTWQSNCGQVRWRDCGSDVHKAW